jgi:perosamine synthetase
MKKKNTSIWWHKSIEKREIIKSISNVIKSEDLSTGNLTTQLEKKISEFLKVKHVIMVSNGSMATLLAFMALEIKPKDEIIVPNVGWISVISACKILNAVPVIVDVEKNRPIIDIDQIEKKITKKTKIVIPVYMNGRATDVNKLKRICKKKKIFLVEDAAQAFGSKYKNKFLGTFGDLGIYSTSITKTFTSGLGGFLAVNNTKLAKKIFLMRRHGFSDIQNIKSWSKYGGNFKITDMQSAIALIQLKNIKKKFSTNISNLKYFQKKLKRYQKFIRPINIDFKNEIPVYNEFIVQNRNKFAEFLKKNDIQTRLSSPNFQNIKFLKKIVDKNGYPNSEEVENNYIYLESGPGLKKKRINRIVEVIENFYSKINKD